MTENKMLRMTIKIALRMTERKCSEWQFVIEKAAAIFFKKIAAAGILKL